MPDQTPQPAPSRVPGPNWLALAATAAVWLWERPDWALTLTSHDLLLLVAGVILASHLSGNDWSQLLRFLPTRKDAE